VVFIVEQNLVEIDAVASNAGNSRVAVALSRAEVKRYQNTIWGISGHRSSTLMVALDSQGVTSY